MDAYYCLENVGSQCQPRECKDVRCDACPNRGKFIPQRPAAEDAGWNMMGASDAVDAKYYTRPSPKSPWILPPGTLDTVSAVKDLVLHPKHYARWEMEPIEFIAINDLPWWLANVIKYTMRFDAKDGLQDLYKARSYLDMKIRKLEGLNKFWEKPVAEERKLNLGAQR